MKFKYQKIQTNNKLFTYFIAKGAGNARLFFYKMDY